MMVNKVKERDLVVGEVYSIKPKVNLKLSESSKGLYYYRAKLIGLTDRLAIFDNGRYKRCEMIKDYGIGWLCK